MPVIGATEIVGHVDHVTLPRDTSAAATLTATKHLDLACHEPAPSVKDDSGRDVARHCETATVATGSGRAPAAAVASSCAASMQAGSSGEIPNSDLDRTVSPGGGTVDRVAEVKGRRMTTGLTLPQLRQEAARRVQRMLDDTLGPDSDVAMTDDHVASATPKDAVVKELAQSTECQRGVGVDGPNASPSLRATVVATASLPADTSSSGGDDARKSVVDGMEPVHDDPVQRSCAAHNEAAGFKNAKNSTLRTPAVFCGILPVEPGMFGLLTA